MNKDAKYLFNIQTSSGVPIYRQIIDQIKTNIATGALKPEDFVPSVRQMASELEINPMTVSKAYSSLQNEGILESIRGQGLKVAQKSQAIENYQERQEDLTPLLKEVRNKAEQLSLDITKVIKLLKNVWEDKDE